MNAKLAGEMEEQAKQLGNAYLPGAQAALHNYTQALRRRRRQVRRAVRRPARADLQRSARPAQPAARARQAGPGLPATRLDDPELKPGDRFEHRRLARARLAAARTQGRRAGRRPTRTGAAGLQLARRRRPAGIRRYRHLDDARQRPDPHHAELSAVQGGQVHQERRQLLSGGPGEGAVRLSRRRQSAHPLGRHGAPAAGAAAISRRFAATARPISPPSSRK